MSRGVRFEFHAEPQHVSLEKNTLDLFIKITSIIFSISISYYKFKPISNQSTCICLDSVPDGESDSELTYKEISLLDLTKLELAFLNCCETGSGRVYSDGLVGLARAFFLAGARQVVVYRDPLPDTERTTAFVSHFYREYTQTNRADVALAAAQRAAHEAGVPDDFWAQYYVMKRHIPKYPNQI